MVNKNKSLEQESQNPVLTIQLEDAQARITEQIDKGNQILSVEISDEAILTDVKSQYETWREYTTELLRNIFSTNEISSEFSHRGLSAAILGGRPPLALQIKEFHRRFQRDMRRLHSIFERLPLYQIEEFDQPVGVSSSIQEIVQIIHRFHLVVRQLRQRYDNRPTLDVNDEYDVQDLLHALLRIFYDDIRPEEYTPSYAGGASRMDFLLKNEKVVIEVKKTRVGLDDRVVGNQLLEDIGHYRSHPDCHTLICFVYDPEGRIANPDGIEGDLSKPFDEMNVLVIVTPKGH